MALILSGPAQSTGSYFAGFLPPKGAARRSLLAGIAGIEASLIFFESARRLPQCLADMAQMLGNRPAAVARELTKLFEEVRRDPFARIARSLRRGRASKGRGGYCRWATSHRQARINLAQEDALDNRLTRGPVPVAA